MFSERTALRLDREAWAEQDERDRLDREAQELRWQAFVEMLRACINPHFPWAAVCAAVPCAMTHAPDTHNTIEGAMYEFAASYGWPSVLRAIAQAMDADAAERAELERRR
jgi:hypothetical protein